MVITHTLSNTPWLIHPKLLWDLFSATHPRRPRFLGTAFGRAVHITQDMGDVAQPCFCSQDLGADFTGKNQRGMKENLPKPWFFCTYKYDFD